MSKLINDKIIQGSAYKPYLPNIKGCDTFKGPCCHTSRWPKEGIETTGKRVGVIGTGASGVQVIQEIGPQVRHIRVHKMREVPPCQTGTGSTSDRLPTDSEPGAADGSIRCDEASARSFQTHVRGTVQEIVYDIFWVPARVYSATNVWCQRRRTRSDFREAVGLGRV